ncbi:MAG: thiamine ABC transporter substrate-binding protein [Ilumatobacteraceae bacterium]|nr:thiamine ABC transporter substrate-binding protein [Ilumatobacteraceae bacterium]
MKRKIVPALLIASIAFGSCSSDNSAIKSGETIKLLAYDAFTPEPEIFTSFTKETGIDVIVSLGGDTGTLVSKALLTAGTPEADVLWGVDNTLISRAIDGKLFDSYEEVDTAAVCVNYDKDFFVKNGLAIPATLMDLALPIYKDMLVIQNPVTSSPGLAFMLATIAKFGVNDWEQYWKSLRANGVKIVDDWTSAYTIEFSGSSGKGKYPLVVSYGSSPPAEVVYSDPPVTEPPTAVMEQTCFGQIEYAGILRGTKKTENAQKLIDFLTGKIFQESMPLTLFVVPVNPDAVLPDVFTQFAVIPQNPLTLDAADISSNRVAWLDTWTNIMLR